MVEQLLLLVSPELLELEVQELEVGAKTEALRLE